jgi:hypothetical protein
MGKYLNSTGLSHIFSLIKSFFVQKTGDTMTGTLRVSNSDITKDVVPSFDKYKSNLIVSDSNDDQIGYFGALQQTSSKEGIQFGTSRAVNGSTVYHGCHVTINSSGSRSVYFDDAAAWRSGLGVPATSSTAQLSAANTFTNTATYRSSTLDRDRASALSAEASSNSYLKFTDKDNESIGYIKHREGTDGKMSMDIFMETETSGNVKTSNGLTMSVDKSGNRSISVTDSAAWREALDVPGLSVANRFKDNNQLIKLTNVDSSLADNGISEADYKSFGIIDSNDKYMLFCQSVALTDGGVRAEFAARNINGGSNVTNMVRLTVNGDGTREVYVSDPAGWRNAIGIGAYGTLTELTSNTTLTASAAKLPLKTFSGVGCSLSSNGIKVAEAGTYMVWGSAYVYGSFTANDIIHLRLYKNSTYLSLESIYRTPIATPYNMIHMGPFIVTLAANDVLYLYAYNQTAARGTIQSSASCGLTIRRIA